MNVLKSFINLIKCNGKEIGKNVKQISFGNNNQTIIMDSQSYVLEGKEINIEITGNVESLDSGSGNVTVYGSVGNKLRTGSGDVTINESVTGDITTGSGDVNIGKELQGNVKTGSGDLKCAIHNGSFQSGSGSIKVKNIY